MSSALSSPPVFQVRAAKPGAELQDLVHCFYWTQITPDENLPPVNAARVLPHAAADIIVCEDDSTLQIEHRGSAITMRGAMLNGPFLSTPTYRWKGKVSIFGIRFKHGVLGRVISFPAKKMVNHIMPLAEVWNENKCNEMLLDPLRSSATFDEKVKIAEKAVLNCFLGAKEADPRLTKAIELILKSKGQVGVMELAKHTGVSRQTLKSKFDQSVGFAPKLFGRLLRFQNTLKALYRSGRTSWSTLARDCGYYDQAHLIREFNHFTGFSPERLLRDIARGESIYYFDQAEQTLSLVKENPRVAPASN